MNDVKAAQVEANSVTAYKRPEQNRLVEAAAEVRRLNQTKVQKEPKTESVSAPALEETVKKLNEFAARQQISISFGVDKSTGRTVIKVIDSSTEKVVRQLPPEEVLELAANMEEMVGALLSASA